MDETFSELVKTVLPYTTSEDKPQCSQRSANPVPVDPVHTMPPYFFEVHYSVLRLRVFQGLLPSSYPTELL
jgi:hypothetical protein